jgi:hypothetical protein
MTLPLDHVPWLGLVIEIGERIPFQSVFVQGLGGFEYPMVITSATTRLPGKYSQFEPEWMSIFSHHGLYFVNPFARGVDTIEDHQRKMAPGIRRCGELGQTPLTLGYPVRISGDILANLCPHFLFGGLRAKRFPVDRHDLTPRSGDPSAPGE